MRKNTLKLRGRLYFHLPQFNGVNRVVVLGGGFAGSAAKVSRGEVFLVDSEDYLTLTPKLVDVVQGADPSSALIERTVDLKAQVREIDVRSKTVRTSLGEIKYDKLILALGYEQSLGVKGAERYALKFERLKDALRLREESGKVKRIIIVGGGSLGVELAGVLGKKAVLVEGGKRLISFMPPEVSDYARKILEERGVQVLLGTSVEEIKKDQVITSSGTFKSDLTVLATGYAGSPIVKEIGAEQRGGRMLVDRSLRSVSLEDVFGAGDCAVFKDGFYPMSAQVALKSGKVAARNALGKEVPFTPSQIAVILRIGEEYFGTLAGKFVRGNTAKFLKEAALALVRSRLRRLGPV